MGVAFEKTVYCDVGWVLVRQKMTPQTSELSLLQLLNVIAEFEGGSQLQSQVFHDHVTPQQQQGMAINLLGAGVGKRKPRRQLGQPNGSSGQAVLSGQLKGRRVGKRARAFGSARAAGNNSSRHT